jgi:hypothetical protein
MSEGTSDVRISKQNASKPPPSVLGINVEKPKFPQYAVISKRKESFESWPEYLPVKMEDMIEAGLVYTGKILISAVIIYKFITSIVA